MVLVHTYANAKRSEGAPVVLHRGRIVIDNSAIAATTATAATTTAAATATTTATAVVVVVVVVAICTITCPSVVLTLVAVAFIGNRCKGMTLFGICENIGEGRSRS